VSLAAIISNVFFANCTPQPFHHGPNECEHLSPCSGEEAYWKMKLGIVPMLVEENEKFEDSSA
jgi:hypothetical protein